MVLPFTIFAWGTAYKLSLYKTETNSAPAKVCTRGSDAAKSDVSQAVDGRKVIGNVIAVPPLGNFSIVFPGRRDVTLSEAYQVIIPPQSEPILAARPPPIGFLFS